MSKIELADGTSFDGELGYTGPTIGLYLDKDIAIQHIADLMDSSKLDPITLYHGCYKNIYHGFNRFSHMEQRADDNQIIIWIAGENTHAEFQIPTVPVEYLPKEQ